MKNITTAILLFSFFYGTSQVLQKQEMIKLNKLNIKFEKLNLNDISVQNNLNKILLLERKRKTNKTVGIILSSISAISIAGGVITFLEKDEISKAIGTAAIVGGFIQGVISIPFWNSSKKRKKERDRLIQMFD